MEFVRRLGILSLPVSLAERFVQKIALDRLVEDLGNGQAPLDLASAL